MTRLVRVGSSLGVRIPKAIILQMGFKENMILQLKVTDEGLLIARAKACRERWSKAFSKSQKGRQEDQLIMGNQIVNHFDEEEWKW